MASIICRCGWKHHAFNGAVLLVIMTLAADQVASHEALSLDKVSIGHVDGRVPKRCYLRKARVENKHLIIPETVGPTRNNAKPGTRNVCTASLWPA